MPLNTKLTNASEVSNVCMCVHSKKNASAASSCKAQIVTIPVPHPRRNVLAWQECYVHTQPGFAYSLEQREQEGTDVLRQPIDRSHAFLRTWWDNFHCRKPLRELTQVGQLLHIL